MNQGTEAFMRNVILEMLSKNSADIYRKVLQCSLLSNNKVYNNKVIVLEILQNDVKCLYFKRYILKYVLPNTF